MGGGDVVKLLTREGVRSCFLPTLSKPPKVMRGVEFKGKGGGLAIQVSTFWGIRGRW